MSWPARDYSGTDNFVFRVSDGSLSDDATHTFTVTAVNDAPTTSDDNISVEANDSVNLDPRAGDSAGAGDESEQTLTITEVSDPAHGTAVIEGIGSVTYTPDADYVGSDSFTYTTCDDGNPAACATATVFVTVNALPE